MNDQTGPALKGRVEDIRFVSGHGLFTADIVPEMHFTPCFSEALLPLA